MPDAQIGPYEITGELGRGAMGVVLRGFDPAIGRPVAIKVIRAPEYASPDEIEALKLRFSREAKAAGKLSHPNIVTVYQLGEHNGMQFIAMEFVEGSSLAAMVAPQTPLGLQPALAILRQIADALDYAHREGIVHRDVKPANVMVRPDSSVKLTDFGIARISSQNVTQTGTTMGTLAYMSPEQLKGAKVDGRADQYSLAVVAYQMLTGQKPFLAETETALMLKIVSEEPVAAHVLNRSLPQSCSQALQRALAKEPQQRFGSCADFVQALSNVALPTKPKPVAVTIQIPKWQEWLLLYQPSRSVIWIPRALFYGYSLLAVFGFIGVLSGSGEGAVALLGVVAAAVLFRWLSLWLDKRGKT